MILTNVVIGFLSRIRIAADGYICKEAAGPSADLSVDGLGELVVGHDRDFLRQVDHEALGEGDAAEEVDRGFLARMRRCEVGRDRS